MRRLVAAMAIAIAAVSFESRSATADTYPSRPIKIIVPTAPGGPLDLLTRALAEQLAARLKQPVVIENKPGAAGNIGSEMAAKSPPDGYTLSAALGTTLSVNPHVYKTMPFDALRDFRPITHMASASQMLVVHPSLPTNSFAEFIAFAKAEPVSYAHAGYGSPGHLAMEYFRLKTGIKTSPVPYRGNAPLVTDLIGGQIKVGFVSTSGVIQHVSAGRLKAFAVSSKERSPLARDVPSVAELGYSDFEFVTPFLLLAPAGLPDDIAALLERETRQILKQPDFQERFAPQDMMFVASGGADAAALMKSEYDLWKGIVSAAGMKME